MKNKLLLVLASGWMIGVSFFITTLHSWHNVSFKFNEPQNPDFMSHLVNDIKEHNVIHFLTPACSCSKVIFNHLQTRAPLTNADHSEKIVLLDDKDLEISKKLKASGYDVTNIKMDELKEDLRKAVMAVPLLLIFDKNKDLRYAGGYSEKIITPFSKIDVFDFLSKIKLGNKLTSYPVKGCAVSEEYKKLLDPMGIKYVSSK